MIQSRVTFSLPGRVTAYHLLFSLLLAGWVSGACVWQWLQTGSELSAVLPSSLSPFVVLLFGTVLISGTGALVTYVYVRPMALIEEQLREVARAGAVSQARLETIPVRSGAAIGWNRLMNERLSGTSGGSLTVRLSGALQGLSRQKADDILNSLADGIAVTKADGVVEFANSALHALLSSDTSLIGRTVESLLELSEDEPAHRSLLDSDAKSRNVVVELSRKGSQGPEIWRVARYPVRNREGKTSGGFVWSVRDITQLKLAEKMRDQFLDAATHELRTPLTNIRAYAETLMLSEVPDVEQQKEFYNTINSEATRLSRFIDDLLTVSSIEVGSLALDRQEVQLDRLLNEAVAKVRPQMEQKGIQYDYVLPEKLPELVLDKDKITAAVVNLLGNAAKYTPPGGHVMLHVRYDDQRVEIDVQDTGIGIAPTDIGKVFEKFYRSEDPRVREENGTGLGLPFAHEVVRLHGGTIEVQSELDKGSTFTITLPLR